MYIVKTEDGYLYLDEGAVTFTDEEGHAGRFPTQDEGHIIAQMFGYAEGRYRIIPTER